MQKVRWEVIKNAGRRMHEWEVSRKESFVALGCWNNSFGGHGLDVMGTEADIKGDRNWDRHETGIGQELDNAKNNLILPNWCSLI